MPWTQINYPLSMKKLPLAVRKKAIEIANALLKKDKKMKEGVVISTAIKNAKTFIAKKTKSVKATPKKKVAAIKAPSKRATTKSTVKATPKKKVAAKKVAKPVKNKAKNVSASKAIVTAKSPAKVITKKKVKSAVQKKAKPAEANQSPVTIETRKNKTVSKKIKKEPKEVADDSFIINPLIPIEEAKGEDQNYIPDAGDVKPVNAFQIHNFENVFHHREEVTMHQENNKVRAAKSSRKNDKRTYRMKGNR